MNAPGPRPLHPALWPTLLCCGLMLAAFAAAVARVSGGFDGWTFEAMRRDEVRQGLRRASPLAVTLADGSARRLWDGDDRGEAQAMLVDFIYTSCPSVCQALGSEYQRMQVELQAAPQPGIRLLSLSFDTARDDVAALAAHARLHRAAAAQWWVGVPSTEGSRRVLDELGVVAVPDGVGGYVHNGAIHLLDREGRLRAVFEYEEWPQALRAARVLAGGAS